MEQGTISPSQTMSNWQQAKYLSVKSPWTPDRVWDISFPHDLPSSPPQQPDSANDRSRANSNHNLYHTATNRPR